VIGAEEEREPIAHFVALAGKYAAAQRKTATEVLTPAHSEFPDFEKGHPRALPMIPLTVRRPTQPASLRSQGPLDWVVPFMLSL